MTMFLVTAYEERRSVLVVLEADKPVEAETVDELSIGIAPWPFLQVLNDPATFAETGKPLAQRRRVSSAQKSQHQAFRPEWLLVTGHVRGEQHDGSSCEVAMGNGIGPTVGAIELLESVQLNCAAEDVTVERQGLASSTGKMHVGRRIGHCSNVVHRSVQHPVMGLPGLD